MAVYNFELSKSDEMREFKYISSIYFEGDNMRRARGLNILDDGEIVTSSFGKTISKGDNTIGIYLKRDD